MALLDQPEAADFLRAPYERQVALIRDPANEPALRALLGGAGYEEFRASAAEIDLTAHLGAHLASGPKSVIFVPGIMGSLLTSKNQGGMWWIDVRMAAYIDRLALTPDGEHDADQEDIAIEPFNTDISYAPLRSAIVRQGLGHDAFPYDWRKPLRCSTAALRDAVVRLHEAQTNGRKIDIVAHSMGGLLVRDTLAEFGDVLRPLVGRIVFIATPHYGSPAIAGYLKNHLWGFELIELLGWFLSPRTLRTMWGALSLLPAPSGTYPGTRERDRHPWKSTARDAYAHPAVNFDLYDVDAWGLELLSEERDRLRDILVAVAQLHRQRYDAHRRLPQEFRDKMLNIVGVGYRSLFRLDFPHGIRVLWSETAKTTSRVRGDPHREGDGTVPLASAELENVETRYVRGKHAALPNLDVVYRDVFTWLSGGTPNLLARTAQGALEAHLGPTGDDPTPHLSGTSMAGCAGSDDSGRWNETPVSPARLDELKAELAGGTLTDFTRVRLL